MIMKYYISIPHIGMQSKYNIYTDERISLMKKNWTNYLYAVTILFFSLGFFNIIFAWFGFACMILPFLFLVKDKKKTWCQKYCPRSSLFRTLFQGRSLTGKPGPDWLVKGKAKWVMLIYFTINLFVLFMSTIMVFIGRKGSLQKVRFLIAFQLPWDIPQFLNIGLMPDWIVHLSFRIYSMMFTTTIIGLLLSWIFIPRTWCTICPINTISDVSLKKLNKRKGAVK